MESHVLQCLNPNLPITIQVSDLNSNSFFQYEESGIIKRYEVKGIEVNKMAQEANTNYAYIQRDLDGNLIKSRSSQIRNLLPFEYFASAQLGDIPMMEAIDKKMLNGVMLTVWGVPLFSTEALYIEPVDFTLESGANQDLFLNLRFGASYTDLQYALKKDEETYGPWIDFEVPSAHIEGLEEGTYTVKVQSENTQLNHIPKKTITL